MNELASRILSLVGGKDNVLANATCMTRLRLTLRDLSLVDQEALRQVEGVMGLVVQDQVQVILGPGKVNQVGSAFAQLTGLSLGYEELAADQVAKTNKAQQKAKYDKPLQRFLQRIANIFIPLLPGIIAAGMINGIANVINVSNQNTWAGEWWFQAIRTMGWALFAFLPIYVGMNAAKEFKGSAVLGGMAGALSVAVPSMPLLAKVADAPILLPITNKAFSPGAGGLLAALFMGIFFAYLERAIRRIMPNLLDTFFTPLLTVVVGVLVSVIVIQPLAALVTDGIYASLDYFYTQLGALGGFILSVGFLPLVSVGLHQALTPIHTMLNNPQGPTAGVNYLLPILMMAGGGQVGAGMALYLKSRNKRLRQLTRDSLPVGILGIGEPMMYAVTLPLGKPFITACLGSGLGGVLAVLFHLGAVSQGVSGLFGLLIMVPGTQISYVIAMLGAYLGGFVLTWFFGVDEARIAQVYGGDSQ